MPGDEIGIESENELQEYIFSLQTFISGTKKNPQVLHVLCRQVVQRVWNRLRLSSSFD